MGLSARNQWVDAVWASDLKPLERLVALAYAKHASKGIDDVWVSYARLRSHTGLSRDAIARAIKGLCDRGWMTQTAPGRQHYSAHFRLIFSGTADGLLESPRDVFSRTGDGPLNGESPVDKSPSSPSPESSSPSKRSQQSGRRTVTTTNPSNNPHAEAVHKHEVNVRNSLTTIIQTRRLPFTVDELTRAAYALGTDGDPWPGYLQINVATTASVETAVSPRAVIVKRLTDRGLPARVLDSRKDAAA